MVPSRRVGYTASSMSEQAAKRPSGAGEVAPTGEGSPPTDTEQAQGAVTPPPPERSRTIALSVATRQEPLESEDEKGWKGLRRRAGEWLESVFVGLRRQALDLVEELRSRDRFTKWKIAITACWALLCLASVQVAASGLESDPTANRLTAYVTVQRTSMQWAVLVENRSRRPWTNVFVVLDQGAVWRADEVPPRDRKVLGPSDFVPQEGLASRPPSQIEIRAKQGKYVWRAETETD